MSALQEHLESLVASVDGVARRQGDPVAFAHRYARPEDQEIAALFAAVMAFGRVSLFWPVLERIFAVADAAGGPAAWLRAVDAREVEASFAGVSYRWTRAEDLAVFALGVALATRTSGGLEPLLGDGPVRDALGGLVDALREGAVRAAADLGRPVASFEELPLGVRHLLPHPRQGSACKRLNLFMRWMVRDRGDGVDLGLWTRLSSRDLVIPVDTHVLRIARLVGLTARKDGSWRTAEDITAALRKFDADDPVRFDFALAHLGISGGCQGRRLPDVCGACALTTLCRA